MRASALGCVRPDAELIAFGIAEHRPMSTVRLADVDADRTERDESPDDRVALGLVSSSEVKMDAVLAGLLL